MEAKLGLAEQIGWYVKYFQESILGEYMASPMVDHTKLASEKYYGRVVQPMYTNVIYEKYHLHLVHHRRRDIYESEEKNTESGYHVLGD